MRLFWLLSLFVFFLSACARGEEYDYDIVNSENVLVVDPRGNSISFSGTVEDALTVLGEPLKITERESGTAFYHYGWGMTLQARDGNYRVIAVSYLDDRAVVKFEEGALPGKVSLKSIRKIFPVSYANRERSDKGTTYIYVFLDENGDNEAENYAALHFDEDLLDYIDFIPVGVVASPE